MKNIKLKKIGIIDGMGAFAGARFFQLLLEKISAEGLAFPEMVLNAVAIEDFIADPTKIAPAKKIISKRIKFFNQQKISMIVMACNTAHIMHSDLLKIANCPFPSIIDLVVADIKSRKINKVGILASPTTLRTKLYEEKLIDNSLAPIIPDKHFQNLLERVIRGVLNNKLSENDVNDLNIFTRNFIDISQLDGIILGCTELPLAFQKSKFKDIKIFDSLDILADAVVGHLKC
ncbi:MAG TPA: amino acid racemase [Candidatus Methanoperedens sp.]|nr:amino acid racemase [Candidatus Methanoperedens sp.]